MKSYKVVNGWYRCELKKGGKVYIGRGVTRMMAIYDAQIKCINVNVVRGGVASIAYLLASALTLADCADCSGLGA